MTLWMARAHWACTLVEKTTLVSSILAHQPLGFFYSISAFASRLACTHFSQTKFHSLAGFHSKYSEQCDKSFIKMVLDIEAVRGEEGEYSGAKTIKDNQAKRFKDTKLVDLVVENDKEWRSCKLIKASLK